MKDMKFSFQTLKSESSVREVEEVVETLSVTDVAKELEVAIITKETVSSNQFKESHQVMEIEVQTTDTAIPPSGQSSEGKQPARSPMSITPPIQPACSLTIPPLDKAVEEKNVSLTIPPLDKAVEEKLKNELENMQRKREEWRLEETRAIFNKEPQVMRQEEKTPQSQKDEVIKSDNERKRSNVLQPTCVTPDRNGHNVRNGHTVRDKHNVRDEHNVRNGHNVRNEGVVRSTNFCPDLETAG